MRCNICRVTFGNGQPLAFTSCGHVFHEQCLQIWIQNNGNCQVCLRAGVTQKRLYLDVSDSESSGREDNNVAEDIETLRAQINSLQAQNKLTASQHELQVQNLTHDILHWQSSIRRLEAENQTLRESRADVLRQRRQLDEINKLNQRRYNKILELEKEHRIMESMIEDFLNKVGVNPWGLKLLSIRNFLPEAVNDPLREITALLAKLSIRDVTRNVKILSCTKLTSHAPLHQIFLEFAKYSTKLELMSKFPQLQEEDNANLRRLQLRDALDTKDLYKKVCGNVRAKPGIVMLTIRENQVLLQISGDAAPSEISFVEQIDRVLHRLENMPSRSSRKHKKARIARKVRAAADQRLREKDRRCEDL